MSRPGKGLENQPSASSSNFRCGPEGGSPPQKGDEPNNCLDLSKDVIESKYKKLQARRLESGHLLDLEVLFLHGNAADLGMRAMLNALRAGHLKNLEQLILLEVSSYDQLTNAEAGTETIAKAIRDDNLPKLVLMDMTGSLPKLIPPRKFSTMIRQLVVEHTCGKGRFSQISGVCFGCMCATALEKGKDQTIECFRCVFGRLEHNSGDAGIRKIVDALMAKPITTLETLLLQENYIRSGGAEKVAELLGSGVLPNLNLVDLRNNPVGYKGAQHLVRAFLDNPLLTVRVRLDWPSLLLEQKAVAFRENNIRLEHMMERAKISTESLVHEEFKYFQEHKTMKTKVRLLCKTNFVTELHLLCQASFENYRDDNVFEDHKVEEGSTKLKGIPVKAVNRPCFNNSLNQQFVDTEHSEMSTKPSEATVVHSDQAAEATTAHRVDCSIIDYKGAWIPKHEKEKLESRQRKQMETIKQELLMLGESKPDSFYEMFGLRQVLLINPTEDNKYSRLWICNPCFKEYKKLTPGVVHSITTDAELNLERQPFTSNGRVR